MFSSNASCIHIDGINGTVEKIWHSAFIFLTAIYMLAKILIRQISKRNYCNFHVRRRNCKNYCKNQKKKCNKQKKQKQNTLETQMQIKVYNQMYFDKLKNILRAKHFLFVDMVSEILPCYFFFEDWANRNTVSIRWYYSVKNVCKV